MVPPVTTTVKVGDVRQPDRGPVPKEAEVGTRNALSSGMSVTDGGRTACRNVRRIMSIDVALYRFAGMLWCLS